MIIPLPPRSRNRKEIDDFSDRADFGTRFVLLVKTEMATPDSTLFESPFGAPRPLQRYPLRKRELLQAWDAADSLLLEELFQTHGADGLKNRKILILGDSFGALSTALSEFSPTTYSDSFVSHRAIEQNRGAAPTPILSSLGELAGPYDLALLRLPKNLSFLDDLLIHISQHLIPGGRVLATTMVKHLSPGVFPLFEKRIGKVTTSLAKKKARLVYATLEKVPSPVSYPTPVELPGFEKPFLHASNLFSREKLDIGTRFLLEHFPEGDFSSILDLGCGNGILGITAARKYPNSEITFTDDSWMALESARVNSERFGIKDVNFIWTNAYQDGPSGAHDLVLCNPPFHQGTRIGDEIAEEMFRNAHRSLTSGGRIRVVGNTHLGYGTSLARLFGNVEKLAQNSKFTIFESRRR